MKIFSIAEIGSNWEGSLAIGKKIIKKCKDAGADAVKFQMWRAEDLYPSHPLLKQIKKTELSPKTAAKFKKFADEIGIGFFCSVFYPEAVDFLQSLNVKQYKIASRTCILKDPLSLETLSAVNKTRKPVIVSMGMGGNRKFIEKTLSKNKTTFCYCISDYPLKIQNMNWGKALKYTGLSDHTLGISVPILFAGLMKLNHQKKVIIEKHVKLTDSKSLDASTSLDISQFKIMNQALRSIEQIKKLS
jgi:N-acetylneuraminate synthase/N,N'-diacetyllegionaminate synthase